MTKKLFLRMFDLWYPIARKSLIFPGAGLFVSASKRGVLHTTEGGSLQSALETYKKTKAYPHLTFDPWSIVWEQHIPMDVAATALENKPGGVQTNLMGAIQIEIVGSCDPRNKGKLPMVSEMSTRAYLALSDGMAWIEDKTGIQPTAPKFVSYPGSYGSDNKVRFTEKQWIEFDGWCGHEHVPENEHGDPGLIDIDILLRNRKKEQPEGEDMNDAARTVRWINSTFAILVAREDGGTEHYDVPFYGNMFTLKPEEKLGFEKITAARYLDKDFPSKGYVLYNQKGQAFVFTPEQWLRWQKEGRV